MKYRAGHVVGNTYELREGYAVGFTSKGEEYYLDAEDIKLAEKHTWMIDHEGYTKSNMRENGAQRNIKLHRIILGLSIGDGKIVDHINRDRSDNRKENLRVVSTQQNAFNQGAPVNNKSGVVGVFYRQRKGKTPKWVASINIEGKTRQIGHFDTMDEAARARKEAESKYYAIKHS